MDVFTKFFFYRARYNSSVLRDEVLTAMVTLVKDRNPLHKVDLTTPQKTVIVEVIKGVCCLSVVTDFYKYRKYNLLEAAKGETARPTNGDKSTVLAAEETSVAEDNSTSENAKIEEKEPELDNKSVVEMEKGTNEATKTLIDDNPKDE